MNLAPFDVNTPPRSVGVDDASDLILVCQQYSDRHIAQAGFEPAVEGKKKLEPSTPARADPCSFCANRSTYALIGPELIERQPLKFCMSSPVLMFF